MSLREPLMHSSLIWPSIAGIPIQFSVPCIAFVSAIGIGLIYLLKACGSCIELLFVLFVFEFSILVIFLNSVNIMKRWWVLEAMKTLCFCLLHQTIQCLDDVFSRETSSERFLQGRLLQVWRQKPCGGVLKAPDFTSGGHSLESHSDHQLELIHGRPDFNSTATLVNTYTQLSWPLPVRISNLWCSI